MVQKLLRKRRKNKFTFSKMWCTTGIYIVSLLFLIFINDLWFVSDVLDSIMFADKTDLFNKQHKINE